jgi:2-polyprenyl-3-methyl-5-hydroxy-6-metoxy-1,4-benzoquinol methylase
LPAPETVPCNLCGNKETRSYLEKDGYHIVKCSRCGLVYVNPRIAREHGLALYTQDYFLRTSGTRGGYQDYLAYAALKEKTFERIAVAIEESGIKPSVLLDIGAAYGHFLKLMRARGWDTYGVELNAEAAEYAREVFGIDVRVGDLSTAALDERRYDVVTMLDTIEHLHDPLGSVTRVYGVVKEGGLIVIQTPSIEGVFSKLLRRRWPHLKPEEHLYYYSRKTIALTLRKAGFSDITVSGIKKTVTLGHLCYELSKDESVVGRVLRYLQKGHFRCLDRPFSLNLDELLVMGRKKNA